MITDYIANDEIFRQLSAELDDCSAKHAWCKSCPLRVDCVRQFDIISDRAMDKTLSLADSEYFRRKFLNFSKQLALV